MIAHCKQPGPVSNGPKHLDRQQRFLRSKPEREKFLNLVVVDRSKKGKLPIQGLNSILAKQFLGIQVSE